MVKNIKYTNIMTTEEKLEIISQVCEEREIDSLITKGAMLEAMNRMDAINIANNIIEKFKKDIYEE